MRLHVMLTLMLLMSWGESSWLSAEDTDVTLIYAVRSTDVQSLAKPLAEAYKDQADITALPAQGALLIRVAESKQAALMKLLQSLDRPKVTIRVKTMLLAGPLSEDDVRALSGPSDKVMAHIDTLKAGGVTVENRAELTVIEGLEAVLQTGKSVPLSSSIARFGGSGRTSSSSRHVEVGTIIQVVAAVTGNGATLQLNYERSQLSTSNDDDSTGPYEIDTIKCQSTLQIQNHHTVSAGYMMVQEEGKESRSSHLLVAIEVLATGDSPSRFSSMNNPTARKPSGRGGGGRGAPRSSAESIARIAAGLSMRLDANRDGKISEEELENSPSGIRIDAKELERDDDGNINKDDLILWLEKYFSRRSGGLGQGR